MVPIKIIISQIQKKSFCFFFFFSLFFSFICKAQREAVLSQIDLPHNYYYRELYLPQLTSGASSACWLPNVQSLVFSMAGSLWMQPLNSDTAVQLTDGDGYDYQPDCNAEGSKIIFVRYNGASEELMLLDVKSKNISALTNNNAVNLEPRFSPDGKQILFVSSINSGHFLLYKANITDNVLSNIKCLTPGRQSEVKRYYYSSFDHAINPCWSGDGKEIYFVSNHEVAHGTGNIVCMNADGEDSMQIIRSEETSWSARPDISPDGTRMLYSSYIGGNWRQLWMLPAKGGYAMPLTYGEYDNTCARWSPDGKKIAFISNRNGNTSLWTVNVYDGKQTQLIAKHLKYLQPHTTLHITVRDEKGNILPARISVTDSREKFYAPADAWIHADDARYPSLNKFEAHYFFSSGTCRLEAAQDKLHIKVSHGPLYEIFETEIDAEKKSNASITITLKKLKLPGYAGAMQCGDLHVHMNYGGHYLNNPSHLVQQASCEDVNYVYNLVVNKEQRIPDIKYFSTQKDKASTATTMLLHGQEFHTSFWGHLGLLHLKDHFILPGYTGYPQTAVASIFPNNSFIADKAHEQNGLVGYAHPFETSDVFPAQAATLKNELPVDAALGKVDYYELSGFSDHKASEAVWYQLLNCGMHIPAAAGTDFMGNYASLRGPVGLNRVYINAGSVLNEEKFLTAVKQGKSFVTNGPIIGLQVENAKPGDSILLNGTQTLTYKAFLRSNIPVDSFEIIYNGAVIAKHFLNTDRKTIDVTGKITVTAPGWLLLRAWSPGADVNCFDIYPYASTNPIYLYDGKNKLNLKSAAEYFLQWVNKIENIAAGNSSYHNDEEKKAVMNDIEKAKEFYMQCMK